MNSLKKSLKANKIKVLVISGLLFVFLGFISGFFCGSIKVFMSDFINVIRGNINTPGAKILAFVRIPRTLAAFFCGSALSVSGLVIGNVLANRLASPGLIGVNAGAGLAVTLCATLGIYGGWILSLSSFLGAFLTVIIISTGSKKWGASRGTVILMGVALNSLLNAFSDMLITFNPDISIMNSDFKIGEFSAVTVERLFPAAALIIISILVLLTLSNELDVITLGDERAGSLGMNTTAVRILFLLISACLAGCAVSVAGLLSFVGLIIPNMVRRLADSQSKNLIILCALFGGAFVCLCDTVARTVFLPYEIPVGMIMAFLGAPFFIYILIKGKGGHKNA